MASRRLVLKGEVGGASRLGDLSQSQSMCYLVHGSVCTGGFELKQIFENNAEGTARVLNLISVTMSHCL